MSLNLTVLSTRWGQLFAGVNEANTFVGTTVANRANGISSNYTTIGGQGQVIDDLYTQAREVGDDLSQYSNYLFTLVQTTLQAQCADDTSRPRTDDLPGWFNKLNRDMQAGSETYSRPIPTSTITIPAIPGTNVGDGYLISSVVEPVDGIVCYWSLAETIRIECTNDSYSGTATAGSESFAIYGETAVDKTAYNYPRGSGVSSTLTAVSLATDPILTDGGLENWSTNTPSNWSLSTGTVAGTHIFQASTSPNGYTGVGTKYAKFAGDGSTAIGINQDVTGKVRSNTNFAVQFWMYSTVNTLSTANLRVALTDGSGTVLNDNAGTAQSSVLSTATLNGADGAWTRVAVNLRTPRSLPANVLLEFKFCDAAGTGHPLDANSGTKYVLLDHITATPMVQLYDGGPYHALIAGATGFAIGDAFQNAISVSYYNSGSDNTNFVRCLNRTFDLAGNGIRLSQTTTGTPTQKDGVGGGSLIA